MQKRRRANYRCPIGHKSRHFPKVSISSARERRKNALESNRIAVAEIAERSRWRPSGDSARFEKRQAAWHEGCRKTWHVRAHMRGFASRRTGHAPQFRKKALFAASRLWLSNVGMERRDDCRPKRTVLTGKPHESGDNAPSCRDRAYSARSYMTKSAPPSSTLS